MNSLLLAVILENDEPHCCLLPNELKFAGVSLDSGLFFNSGSLLFKSNILQQFNKIYYTINKKYI